jgi:hypothetical protein
MMRMTFIVSEDDDDDDEKDLSCGMKKKEE